MVIGWILEGQMIMKEELTKSKNYYYTMNNIAVTGSSGFIGKHLVEALKEKK